MASPGVGGWRLAALPIARPAGVALQPQGAFAARARGPRRDRCTLARSRNRFGHRAPDVVERYRERGIAVVATGSCGAWPWRADGGEDGGCEPDVERRCWHRRIDADPR